ncbi:hypothetical protein [uncultured Parvimonas sp.]|uniref:hypothetical protein n=1 Tax=uncultured Parvimonas sp. TaxID=747372 RepID=UPI0028D1CD3F|nr:hypothetical protein [uncultured Parvimonas sp.]
MYILEGIAKAIGLVILVIILMLLAKEPTAENKFTMRKYIKWIFTIEIVLIIYITIMRLYFEYSFLSYTFVIGIIISATTAYRLMIYIREMAWLCFFKKYGDYSKGKDSLYYFKYHLYSLFFGERDGGFLLFGFVEIILILFPMVIFSNLLAFLISNLILGNGWSIVI